MAADLVDQATPGEIQLCNSQAGRIESLGVCMLCSRNALYFRKSVIDPAMRRLKRRKKRIRTADPGRRSKQILARDFRCC
jgi:hypothetical protein